MTGTVQNSPEKKEKEANKGNISGNKNANEKNISDLLEIINISDANNSEMDAEKAISGRNRDNCCGNSVNSVDNTSSGGKCCSCSKCGNKVKNTSEADISEAFSGCSAGCSESNKNPNFPTKINAADVEAGACKGEKNCFNTPEADKSFGGGCAGKGASEGAGAQGNSAVAAFEGAGEKVSEAGTLSAGESSLKKAAANASGANISEFDVGAVLARAGAGASCEENIAADRTLAGAEAGAYGKNKTAADETLEETVAGASGGDDKTLSETGAAISGADRSSAGDRTGHSDEDISRENSGEKLIEIEKARAAAEERAAELEARLFCIERGVPYENAADVIALARASGGELNAAIEAALEKYPFFRNNSPAERKFPATTGVHISSLNEGAPSGVEEAFRRSNPNLRF